MVFFLGLAGVIGGFIAVLPLFSKNNPGLKTVDAKLAPFKIVIGIAIVVIGAIRLIVPFRPPERGLIPIFGDFLPAVAAIALGLLISIEFFNSLKAFQGPAAERMKEVLHKYQYPIGFAGILFGILHWFLFGSAFF